MGGCVWDGLREQLLPVHRGGRSCSASPLRGGAASRLTSCSSASLALPPIRHSHSPPLPFPSSAPSPILHDPLPSQAP